MKDGWQTKTLGEMLQTTESVNPILAPNRDFEYIDVSSVSNTTFRIESTQHLKGKEAPSRARRLVRSKDVLFATIRPTLQRIAVVPDSLDGQVCSTGYFVLRPTAAIDPRFVFYYLFTKPFRDQMEGLQKGASYPAVNDSDVRAQLIAFPSIEEQKRIVGVLDEAFEGIAVAKANAEKNLQNARTLFESHLECSFVNHRDKWATSKLGDTKLLKIIDGDRGVNYPKASDFYDQGHCLFLNTKNVRPDGFNFESKMFITAAKDSQLRKGKLARNDVVMTTRGTIGNIGLFAEDVPFENMRINSGMLIFRTNGQILLPSFLFELLRSKIVKDQIKKQSTGAAQPQLPIKILANFEIPVPISLEEQSALVKEVRSIEFEAQHLESIYQQKLAALEELKQALLHQAFTGKL